MDKANMDNPSTNPLQERANFPLQDCLHYRSIIEDAFDRVARSGQTILASGVRGFEEDFAAWLGRGLTAEHCIGVGNGTDALELAMRCAGVEAGDGVIVPSLTAYATVAAILRVGAHPIFADVEDGRPVISVIEVEQLLLCQFDHPCKIRAVIAVHLYGEACDIKPLRNLCSEYSVALIEDCAQSTGTTYEGSPVGTWGDYAAFSFYPTKNLAALGDGGMLVLGPNAEPSLLTSARRLRFYGWNDDREAVQFGVNSRLDEVQAWILKGKLANLSQQIESRRKRALDYEKSIKNWANQAQICLPQSGNNWCHSYHLYVITVEPQVRDDIISQGKVDGIPYGIHYSLACHQHPYIARHTRFSNCHLPNSERLAASVLTLPLNPYLTTSDVVMVSDHLRSFFDRDQG
jgi:dTDP-4-amino-4,6-dideoxygalactose transaminase